MSCDVTFIFVSLYMSVVHVRVGDDIIFTLGDGDIITWLSIVHDYFVLMTMFGVHVCIWDDVIFGLGDDDIIPRLSSVGCVYNSFVRGGILQNCHIL